MVFTSVNAHVNHTPCEGLAMRGTYHSTSLLPSLGRATGFEVLVVFSEIMQLHQDNKVHNGPRDTAVATEDICALLMCT